MKVSIALFFLSILFGCKDSYYWKKDYINHRFDKVVINRISLYDTLRQTILQNYNEFPWDNTKTNLIYVYNFDTSNQRSGDNHFDIPRKIRPHFVQLFNKIGQDNIVGFIIEKDSSLEILVRNTFIDKYYLDVRERLSWYPQTNKIEKFEFPIKDTLLTEKWQYQIWYDKRSEF
jgi:hypothetical protein